MGFVNYALAWLTVTRDFKSDGYTSSTTRVRTPYGMPTSNGLLSRSLLEGIATQKKLCVISAPVWGAGCGEGHCDSKKSLWLDNTMNQFG